MNPLIAKIIDSESATESQLFAVPGRNYSFLNPVSYLFAIKHPESLLKMDGIFADGQILASSIKWKYGVKVTRRSFDMTSIAPRLFSHAAGSGKSVYLVGAQPSQIDTACSVLKSCYPSLNILGNHHGYFLNNPEVWEKLCRDIVVRQPDYVIAGMGTGGQEEFLVTLRNRGYKGIGFTCGGFFSQLAMSGMRHYPAWVDKSNLRFIYRFLMEPHTRLRYIRTLFYFPPIFLFDDKKQDVGL